LRVAGIDELTTVQKRSISETGVTNVEFVGALAAVKEDELALAWSRMWGRKGLRVACVDVTAGSTDHRSIFHVDVAALHGRSIRGVFHHKDVVHAHSIDKEEALFIAWSRRRGDKRNNGWCERYNHGCGRNNGSRRIDSDGGSWRRNEGLDFRCRKRNVADGRSHWDHSSRSSGRISSHR
jgi:hypothetical protein